jgi:hypothetical protein
MLVNILVLAVLLLKLVDLYMIMEVSSNGNSASNTTPHSFTSSEHSRKRKQGCKVVTTLSAVAPANGDQCIREIIKRTRVEDLSSLDSTKPTCLHGRFAKRVFTRGNHSSQREVWPLSWENAISEQQPALESEEEVAEAKAKLLKGLGLFDSDSVIPGIYRDSGITGEAQWQSFERQEQLIRQSQGHANVQFAWPSLENEEEFMDVKGKLIKGLGEFGSDVLITGIYRDTSSKGQARQEAFERQEQLTRENRGNANVQYAWHGSSKAGVSGIILHGFGQPRTPRNGSAYGVGVYLAPENHAEVSAVYADNDENGEQHMLLCRVILGTAELVLQGSDRFHPSSENFDTGVDDLSDPKRLIIWSTHMNTHILPLYVVSFKLSPKWHSKFLHLYMTVLDEGTSFLIFPSPYNLVVIYFHGTVLELGMYEISCCFGCQT